MFAFLIDVSVKRLKIPDIVGNILGVFIVISCIIYIQPYMSDAYKNTSKVADIKQTGEYDIASWLNSHTDSQKGERVFMPGNYGFYLNYFTNVWQHRGALFQASISPWPDVMHYQMATGKNAELAHAWLVIANTKYAVITGDGTREMYKEMKAPERFLDYQPVYSQHGDTIYAVPIKRPSNAKPVNLSQLSGLRTPAKGDDKEALFAYANWIENSSTNQTSFSMIDNDTYHIQGEIGEGEGVLVQMAADSGWRAKDSATGNNIKITKDPLSFMILYPRAGQVDITLTHGRSLDEYVGYLITFVTIIFVFWYGLFRKKPHDKSH
jgi:hypothetical protein